CARTRRSPASNPHESDISLYRKELLRLRTRGQRPRSDFTPRSSTLCLEGHTKSTAVGVDGLRALLVPYFDGPAGSGEVLFAIDDDGLPIDQATAFDNPYAPFCHRSQSFRINAVLDLEHASRQRCLGVTGAHRHRGLRDDRAGIHF